MSPSSDASKAAPIRTFADDRYSLDGKSVFVTGATGSFGRAFVRAALRDFKPRRLIVFSRDELKQFEMQQHPDFRDQACLRYFLGDVRDVERLEMAMRDVDVVVHAAALKQVPAAEYNPFECIRTNVHGAENVVRAAIRVGVPKIIALSTDKAANPINLYGASKLASDKIFVAANTLAGEHGPRFAVVRYGNVIGSRGSVVPFFKKLVAEGAKTLPITDPEMTRFMISIEAGVNFVLSSLTLMQGGEIFVPKIPSLRIVDVAKWLAPQLGTTVVGIRPGEKLHELLIGTDDARSSYELDDRFIIAPSYPWWDDSRPDYGAARRPAANFSYASDNNAEWMSQAQFAALSGA